MRSGLPVAKVRSAGEFDHAPSESVYAIPTNRNVVLPPMVPKLTDVKVIDYDFSRFGASETRKRLLERWEREINSAPK